MKFIQDAKILVASGSGGNGCVSFRREKNIEFGGPDGGNGGRGGSVIVKGSARKATLIDFRLKQHYSAKKGGHGAGARCAGKSGEDCVLVVPLGTEIWHEGCKIADIVDKNQEVVLLEGGRGGAGNYCFKSSVHRAPSNSCPGGLGKSMWIELKLKLLADVGLIGFPNAGKSTLLNALTQAGAKVGNYPFTTLFPQLGVLRDEQRELILADLPGLIEEAHKGKGLGHRFLSHAQRCQVLVHVLDATQENLKVAYQTIREELYAYDAKLADKKEIIVLNKSDLLEDTTLLKAELEEVSGGREVFVLSGLERTGLSPLIYALEGAFSQNDAQKSSE